MDGGGDAAPHLGVPSTVQLESFENRPVLRRRLAVGREAGVSLHARSSRLGTHTLEYRTAGPWAEGSS